MKRLIGPLFVSALSLSLLTAGPAEAGRGYHHHHGGGGLSAGEAILGLGVIGLTAGAIAAIATAPPPSVYYPAPAYVRPPVAYRPAPIYAPPPVVYYAPPANPAPGVMDATPSSPVFTGPGGATCREFQSSGVINGRQQPIVGTACLQGDGSWRVVQ